MEVASPINFNPGGTKRSMACSPMDETMSFADISGEHRVQKRRKFHNDTTVESLSSAFSIHSPFINHDNMGSFATQAPYKRHRNENNCQDDTSCIIEEQKKEIDTLKAEKADVEASLRGLTQENERITKENHILRRAVQIQEERRGQAEVKANAEQRQKAELQERVRKMEQLLLSLRFHLHAQQPGIGNDFMGLPPQPPEAF